MMKNKNSLYYLLVSLLFVTMSCKEDQVLFTGDDYQNIMQYLLSDEDQYSSFVSIVRAGEMEHMLSSYNSNIGGQGYSLFLPNNTAVDQFIDNSNNYNSLAEILADSVFSKEIVKYHALNAAVLSESFPNGVLPTRSLSEDLLTVIFTNDDGVVNYRINNQTTVLERDIELSNGIIHKIDQMLEPVVYTAYGWVEKNAAYGYNIFHDLLVQTGMDTVLNDYELDEIGRKIYTEYTLIIESDDLYNNNGISSFSDLAARISPDDADYKSTQNALNKYMRYHTMVGSFFLDEFSSDNEGVTSKVYETYGHLPVAVDFGLDLKFNVGTPVYDKGGDLDTTINYILVDNANSNKLTKTGAMHQLDQMLHPFLPGRTEVTLQFYNDKAIATASEYEGVEKIPAEDLTAIVLEGVDYLSYTKESSGIPGVSNRDYVDVYGNYTLTYTTPRILAGKYKIEMIVHSSSRASDFLCFFNDVKLGSFFKINGETSKWLYTGRDRIVLGEVTLDGYNAQEIKFNAVFAGRLMIDRIIFKPI